LTKLIPTLTRLQECYDAMHPRTGVFYDGLNPSFQFELFFYSFLVPFLLLGTIQYFSDTE